MTMPSMSSGGINYVATGQGSPTLLFVHGFACALADWDAQIAALSGRYRCVAIDLPAHGGSPLGAKRTMPDLAAVVNEIRDTVAPGPVVLVGHSLGVRIIADAYLARPDGVEGLVFVDGRFYDGDPVEVEARMARFVDSEGFEAFVRKAFAGMFTERADQAVRRHVVERAASMDPVYGRQLMLESIVWDSTQGRDALRRIKVPLLHLQSSDIDEQRRMTSLKPGMCTPFMALVEELVPGARVDVVPDVGHFATLDAPDVVTAQIADFLAGLGEAGRG